MRPKESNRFIRISLYPDDDKNFNFIEKLFYLTHFSITNVLLYKPKHIFTKKKEKST